MGVILQLFNRRFGQWYLEKVENKRTLKIETKTPTLEVEGSVEYGYNKDHYDGTTTDAASTP